VSVKSPLGYAAVELASAEAGYDNATRRVASADKELTEALKEQQAATFRLHQAKQSLLDEAERTRGEERPEA